MHGPEHAAVDAPGADPYTPGGHGITAPEPGAQYDPAGQVVALNAVAEIAPAAQKKPGAQGPEHSGAVRPCASPYLPAGHGSASGEFAQ